MEKRLKFSGYTWGLCMLSLLLVVGCAIGKDHFSRNFDVTEDFKEGRVLKNHQYYHFGYPHSPDAVVAIREGYTLASPKWQPISLDERQLKDWVERIQNNPGAEHEPYPYGADIVDNKSEVIGAWYSAWRLPVLTFTDETTLTISDPIAEFPSDHPGSGGDGDDVHSRRD